MSSEYSLLALLTQFDTSLYKFGGPILIGVGTVSCIVSLMVFSRKNLRKNPCSIYLMACNVCNFLLIYTSILFSTLQSSYSIDPSEYNLAFCHFRYYTMFLFDVLSPCYLILASIDRILITSRNALTRQRSTPRLAYICIISITLFWVLFHIHALFFTNFVQIVPGSVTCYLQSGIYVTVVGYYILIKVILILLLMAISGLWAVKNVRGLVRVAPPAVPTAAATVTRTTATRDVHAGHSKDRQLLQILLIDISIYITFNIMLSVILMYQQITQDPSQSIIQTLINIMLVSIAGFSTFIPFCVGCYTNLLISKTFRHEIKNMLMCK